MEKVLANRVGELVDLGWGVKTQTDTTVALETRGPFNWLLFAVLLFIFLGIGAAIYATFWLLTSRVHLFLSLQDGKIVTSGDMWYLEIQEQEREKEIERIQQIKQRGFWSVMWPSVLAWVAIMVIFVLFLLIVVK